MEDDRPHPGPLPQKKEKHSLRFSMIGTHLPFERRAVNTREAEEISDRGSFPSTPWSASLSPGAPGERAGVRASVSAS